MKRHKESSKAWLPHLIGIMFFIVLPIAVSSQSDYQFLRWGPRYYAQLLFVISSFYFNYLFIVPRFLFTGKTLQFATAQVIIIVSLLTVYQFYYVHLDRNKPPKESQQSTQIVEEKPPFGLNPRLFNDFIQLVLSLGFSASLGVMQQSRRKEDERKEAAKAHVETELAFLKNQINPHFFFNSLNNIYALIAMDSAEAQKAVETLSSLMRYLIYESDTKLVKLQKELDFTRNYIDLVRKRLSQKIKLVVDIQKEIADVEIPPLIFIPFIENAFKHGISYREDSFVMISLKIHDDQLVFRCNNSIHSAKAQGLTEPGGVGQVNIKKRLDLIYGHHATLRQDENNQTFSIELTLPLGFHS